MKKTAVVTGASAGIGEATARRLVAEGFDVVIGARRIERIEKLAAEIGARWASLDVTDQASVDAFCAPLTTVHVLVNNAGGAKGLAHVAEADEEHWRWMYETNVLGLMRVTRALLPALERSGDGHIVNLGSIAGIEAYPGGAGYTSVKHGVRAISQSLRQELLGRPIRVSEIAPGLVETEFSLVRFAGDTDRAAKVYADMQPLTADDIADCIAWVVTRPSHVNIDYMLVMPRAQAKATLVHRNPGSTKA